MTQGTQKVVTDEVLSKLPKKTPAWAVGVVAVIVALATSFTTVYLLSKDDIRQYVGWYQTHKDNDDVNAEREYSQTLNAVLSLVNTNSQQITELSKSLGVAQQQNIALTERVNQLEKHLSVVTANLESCEGKLRTCKDFK